MPLTQTKLPLIITRSHADSPKLFVWLYVSQVKANKTTVAFISTVCCSGLLALTCSRASVEDQWCLSSVWWRSHITRLHFWSTNRWPSTSVPRLSLLLSSNNNNQFFNIRRFWRTTYKSYASPAGLLAAKLTLLKRFFDPALLWFTFLSPF